MKKVTILVPCFNEEQSLPLLYDALVDVVEGESKYDWEFLFVNDGSKDKTADILFRLSERDKRVAFVNLSRNFGKENAMLAGFDYASGDAVVIMDADLQHPPMVVPDMLRKWEEGYDDVYGVRITRGKESWLRKQMTHLYYKILQSSSSNIDVLPNVGDFRLLDRKCVDGLKSMREYGRYTKGMYCYIGFRKTYIEFETQDRVAGQSSMSYKRLIKLAIEGITSYTTVPLKVATFIGLLVSAVAFCYMLYVGIKALLYGDPVAGYPTLLVVILFLGGVQLLTIGIIGEYLGRVFNEVKHRPIYFVQSSNKNM